MRPRTRKLLGILLTLVMVLGLFPAPTLAAPGEYNVWVAGVQITDSNKDDVLDDGGTVKFDPATYTLTLNNADFTAVTLGSYADAYKDAAAGIYSRISLGIEMLGTNFIRGKDNASDYSYGIVAPSSDERTFTFFGSGALTVNGSNSVRTYGISAKNVLVKSGTLNVLGGNANNGNSVGINIGTSLTVDGGTVTAVGGSGGVSYGVDAVNSYSTVEINGGTVTATGNTRAFGGHAPTLNGTYQVAVNTNASATGATAWNGTDALGGDSSPYKYVSIEKIEEIKDVAVTGGGLRTGNPPSKGRGRQVNSAALFSFFFHSAPKGLLSPSKGVLPSYRHRRKGCRAAVDFFHPLAHGI